MPANIAAIIYIHIALVLGSAVSFFSYKKQEVVHCLIIWSLTTTVSFLIGNFWGLFFFIVVGSLFILKNQRRRIPAYYFMALPVLPLYLEYQIPSPVPGTQTLLNINYFRLLSIFILFPLFFSFIQRCYFSKLYHMAKTRFIESYADLMILVYSFMLFALTFRDEPSLTSALKHIIYISLLIPIPYFVLSRYVQTLNDFKHILSAILWGAVILSFIALLQTLLEWNIYNVLHYNIGMEADRLVFGKHFRSGFMRVGATMEHPIAFGYFMTLVMGILLLFKRQKSINFAPFIIHFAIFSVVLFLTGSRSAWMGAFLIISAMWVLSNINYNYLLLYIISGMVFMVSAWALFKKMIILMDPFGTFNYRISLIENSLSIIRSNFWLGSSAYKQTSEMEALRQGQGIIDIVNTYIQIALDSGIIGLSLFILIFIILIYQILKYLKQLPLSTKGDTEYFHLGVFLVSALFVTMVYIATTSSLGSISIYYWSLIGLGSAYLRSIKEACLSSK